MMHCRSKLLTCLVALTLMGSLACKKAKLSKEAKAKKATQGRSATEIVELAQAMLQRKKWQEARKVLRILEENLPSSKEYPRAKLMLGDTFFFQTSPSFPEAQVEYQSFLTYFPRHEMRPYALYHLALCHYATIETAERDQVDTRKAIDAFQRLIEEAPGSPYAVDAKSKINQCWRRLAEAELTVGIFYAKAYPSSSAGEKRIKEALETYPDFVDRERAYFFLGEVLRRRLVEPSQLDKYGKDYLSRLGKDDFSGFTREETRAFFQERQKFVDEEVSRFRTEARNYYQRLVESYPNSTWSGRAKDRLIEMGQTNVTEELDS